MASSPTSRPIEDDPSSPARRAGSLSHARSRLPPASSFPDDRVHPAHSARAAAPEGEGESAGRRECRRQRDQLPEAIRELVVDDQRLRNDICWSVFDC